MNDYIQSTILHLLETSETMLEMAADIGQMPINTKDPQQLKHHLTFCLNEIVNRIDSGHIQTADIESHCLLTGLLCIVLDQITDGSLRDPANAQKH